MAYWLNIALPVLSYGITILALALVTIAARKLIAIYKAGQPDPTRSGNRRSRLAHMLGEILGHTKMLNFTGTGIAHWVVMVGFVTLFGTLLTAYGQVINPYFSLPLIGHFIPYEYITELIAVFTGLGIVTLIGIRQFTRIFRKGKASRFYGSGSLKAYYVEATILER